MELVDFQQFLVLLGIAVLVRALIKVLEKR